MIREFRLRTERELARLGERLASVAGAWSEQWLADAALLEVGPPCGEPGAWERVWVSRAEPECFCGVRAEPGPNLAAALVGAAPGGLAASARQGVMADVTRRALADLARRLLAGPGDAAAASEAGSAPEPAPRGLWAAGSGACEIVFAAHGVSLHCVLSAAAADAWLGGAPLPRRGEGVLVPLRAAVSDVELQARGVVGSGELPLGALAKLSVGDVIAIDHRVDQPSTLLFPELSLRCEAFLCERDGKSALLLEASGPAREGRDEISAA